MNSLLNPESKLMLIFTKIAYSAYLNILWFLCCLPVGGFHHRPVLCDPEDGKGRGRECDEILFQGF